MRISYKYYRANDAPFRVKWFNNPKANKYLSTERPGKTTLKKEQEWYTQYAYDEGRQFFTIRADQKPIGCMGLLKIDRYNRNAEIFIIIGEDDFRGKGIGKRSLGYLLNYGWRNLNLHKITLEVNELNKPAINCYQAAGFTVEAVLKENLRQRGRFVNMVIMSIFNKN